MKNILVSTFLFGLLFSQETVSTKNDSLFLKRFEIMMEPIDVPSAFRLSIRDSLTPVWKTTFRSMSGEYFWTEAHLRQTKFVGVGFGFLSQITKFTEWLGLKENTYDDEGNKLDDFEAELYNEIKWQLKMRQKINEGDF
jgi:hypothetical protein